MNCLVGQIKLSGRAHPEGQMAPSPALYCNNNSFYSIFSVKKMKTVAETFHTNNTVCNVCVGVVAVFFFYFYLSL